MDAHDRAPDVPAGPPAWVLGSTGMLGSAVVRRLRALGREVLTTTVAWTDHESAVATLLAAADELPEGDWETYWCAGAAVTGSPQDDVAVELAVFEELLDRWRPSGDGRRGLFLASSAGGVYAGSVDPPFTEHTEAAPLSPYGHAKLRMEELATAFAGRTGTALLVGRLSNLYGPGQDLSKPQGLVSTLCRAQLTRQPVSVYVPLDTMRDYLFVDDAAAMVVAGTGQVREHGVRALKVLASERSATVGAVLGDLRRITRRRPPIVLGTSPSSRFQVHDLRLRSVAWPDTSPLARTPMGAGMAATLRSIGSQVRPALPRWPS